MRREETIAIAEETIRLYDDIFEHFPQMGTTSVLHTCEEMAGCLTDDKQQPQYDTQIEVSNIDTINCARKLILEGLNPLVLNFANGFRAGGGWRHGCAAQEENLFFKSTYGRSLAFEFNPATKPFYPLLVTACIYSPNVIVFRDENYNIMQYETCFPVNFVACAAIRDPNLVAGRLNAFDEALTRQKLQLILDVASFYNHDSLVLGAFGCGAFNNPPEHMAQLFRETLSKPAFIGRFKKVAFGVLGRCPAGMANVAAFQKEFPPTLSLSQADF